MGGWKEDGRTDGLTDGRTDGRNDGRTYGRMDRWMTGFILELNTRSVSLLMSCLRTTENSGTIFEKVICTTECSTDPRNHRPTGRPSDRPTNPPVDRPGDPPANRPTDRPPGRPTDPTADRPGDRPTDRPADRSTDRLAGPRRPTDRPVKQTSERPTDRPSVRKERKSPTMDGILRAAAVLIILPGSRSLRTAAGRRLPGVFTSFEFELKVTPCNWLPPTVDVPAQNIPQAGGLTAGHYIRI